MKSNQQNETIEFDGKEIPYNRESLLELLCSVQHKSKIPEPADILMNLQERYGKGGLTQAVRGYLLDLQNEMRGLRINFDFTLRVPNEGGYPLTEFPPDLIKQPSFEWERVVMETAEADGASFGKGSSLPALYLHREFFAKIGSPSSVEVRIQVVRRRNNYVFGQEYIALVTIKGPDYRSHSVRAQVTVEDSAPDSFTSIDTCRVVGEKLFRQYEKEKILKFDPWPVLTI